MRVLDIYKSNSSPFRLPFPPIQVRELSHHPVSKKGWEREHGRSHFINRGPNSQSTLHCQGFDECSFPLRVSTDAVSRAMCSLAWLVAALWHGFSQVTPRADPPPPWWTPRHSWKSWGDSQLQPRTWRHCRPNYSFTHSGIVVCQSNWSKLENKQAISKHLYYLQRLSKIYASISGTIHTQNLNIWKNLLLKQFVFMSHAYRTMFSLTVL